MASLTSSVRYSSEKWYYESHKPLQWSMNDFYHYCHTKNFQLEESADDFHDICFDSIVHATHADNKNSILNNDDPEFAHFRGHPKVGYTKEERLEGRNFLWLSPFVCPTEIQKIQSRMYELSATDIWGRVPENYKKAGRRELKDEELYRTWDIEWTIRKLSMNYGKSPALLMDESRYGTHGFIIPFATLLKCMASHHGVSAQDLTLYDMGTFTYYKEQMHTVLICPREDSFFKPMVDGSKIFCRPKSEDDKYHWFVRSTQDIAYQLLNSKTEFGLAGLDLYEERKWQWEHLSFACLLQPDRELLIPRGQIQCKLLKHNPVKCIPAKRTGTWACPDLKIQDGRDPLEDITTTLQNNTSKRTIDEVDHE